MYDKSPKSVQLSATNKGTPAPEQKNVFNFEKEDIEKNEANQDEDDEENPFNKRSGTNY